MKPMTNEQVLKIIDLMNQWEQLRETAIPLRFKEDFLDKEQYEKQKPPKFPFSRVMNFERINSAGLCPVCHSTAIRKPWIFGKRYCINSECDFSKNPITGINLILYYLKKLNNK